MRFQGLRHTGGASGASRISRRDFLKVGGTGLAGAALLGSAGCGIFEQGGGQQGGGSEGQTSFTFDLGADIPDLSTTTTTDSVSFDILNNIMEGLYRLDENEEPQPAMAEGVEVSDDQLTYTFTLRDNIQWSNGDPVTSQDFRYAWLRAMNPDTAGQYSFIVSEYIEGGAEFNAGDASAEDVAIETPDDRTIEVTLANPTPFFLDLTSFITYFPQKQEFVEQQGEDYAQSADALLYNGPFRLTEFSPSNGAVLEKNEDYWDRSNVGVERIDLQIIKEVDTRVNLYEGGELDVGKITSEYVNQYKDSPAFNTIVNFATFYMQMNLDDPALQNENIRRALQMAFDRNALADTILNNGSVGAEGLVPPGMAGPGNQAFREAVGPTMPDPDPQRAREVWQQGVEELGQEPGLTVLTQDTPAARDAGTFLQSELQENLGVDIEIDVQPFDQFLERNEAGDFQLSLSGWMGDYNDPMTFLDLFLSDSPFNDPNYQSERYDELINSAKTESDEARRMDMLVEAERLLVEDDAVIAPVYHEGEARLIRPSMQNLVFHPYGAATEFKYTSIE